MGVSGLPVMAGQRSKFRYSQPVSTPRCLPEDGFHAAWVAAHGQDYGQALNDVDPKIALEDVGRAIG